MLKRTLMALAMVGMAASPALADLLVPDQVINPQGAGGTIGVYGASVNGVAVASPGFLGGGGVASQVSIPANPSDTIQVTFAFHWPFSTYYPVPYLGVQWQNFLVYDNSEVQVLGATGAGGWTAVNFGFGPSNSKMTSSVHTSMGGLGPGPQATQTSVSGRFLKGFPNGTAGGTVSARPGFGRFAVNPPNTFTVPFTSPTANGATMAQGMLIPFSSTFPIMKVTLHVKSVVDDGGIDLFVPPTSAFLIFRLLLTSTSMNTSPSGAVTTQTNTFADTRFFFTGSAVGLVGGDFGVDVVPEPASAALMGIGLFCFVGGAWHRRRRNDKVAK